MPTKSDLTILLPIYNPPDGWIQSLTDSFKKLGPLFSDTKVKIMLINDGSSVDLKNGVARLKSICHQMEYVAYARNQGKGYAIRTGMRESNSKFYIYTDWDFPFGERAVHQAYQTLAQNQTDLLIGVRSKSYFASLPLFRKIISRELQLVSFFMLGFKYVDTQAGIKGLNNEARAIFLNNKTNGFTFELEFIRDCFRRHMRISYQAVDHKPDIKFTNFGWKTVSKEAGMLLKIMRS